MRWRFMGSRDGVMSSHVVATVDEIGPGRNKVVTIKGREIVVFNVKGEFFALLNRCPHQGAPLAHGKLVGLAESDMPGRYRMSRAGEMLRCPWHGWEYDIRTGQSWCDPSTVALREYHVAVESGETIVKGPYVVESFAVTVEQRYVVVEV
jgi:nitrite reductase/ring-hydroxylating ferredoxin subunit